MSQYELTITQSINMYEDVQRISSDSALYPSYSMAVQLIIDPKYQSRVLIQNRSNS